MKSIQNASPNDGANVSLQDFLISAQYDMPLPAKQVSPETLEGCIFCKVANSEVNAVFRRQLTMYARLDNFPASPGHVEIVPFRHVVSFFDLTQAEVKDLYALAQRIRDWQESQYKPDGYTIGINDGAAAGQTVGHLHMHIIPRWHGDVPNPTGGIRRIFPDFDPQQWLD
ncbi:HIT family protein [Pseudarthrobacter phenanthrenivorans]|nr:HIT domain-containing protein [Pseudarthrobacter phenanthrenivorans]